MAIIANRKPRASAASRRDKVRVVVKLKPGIRLPYSAAANLVMHELAGDSWKRLVSVFPGVQLKPYFSSFDEAGLRAMTMTSASRASGDTSPFASYYALEADRGTNLSDLAIQAARLPNVEIAYVEGGPTPPPLEPADDPLHRKQRYLQAAPVGIDARYAWEMGLDGSTVGFVDLEQGWTLDHEDLSAATIPLISGVSFCYHGHGTAVLGQVVAADNKLGCVGIAPSARARVVSQYRSSNPDDYSTADAILSAVSDMDTGDVLLLEAQTSYEGYPGEDDLFPVEVEGPAFDAIAYATGTMGIVVVEAAGNGYRDLDTFADRNGKFPLNRNSPDFRDSGAILVGAASSRTRARLAFSNYGSRVDCFAWGERVTTCGDGWLGHRTDSYTDGFGGTSGASPIITGAAILLQQHRKRETSLPYEPLELRELLSNASRNTASADPAADRIGVMPDLRAILTRREDRPVRHRLRAVSPAP